VTDSQGNTYTERLDVQNAGAASPKGVAVYTCQLSAALTDLDTITINWNSGAQQSGGFAFVLDSRINAAGIVSTSTVQTGLGTSWTTGSISPGGGSWLVMAIASTQGAANMAATSPSGWDYVWHGISNSGQTNTALYINDTDALQAAGTYSASGTWAASGNGISAAIAIPMATGAQMAVVG